jgi:type I restriction enzyme S subunit
VQGQKIKGVIKDGGWQRVYPGDLAISGMNAHLGGMGVSDSLGKCSPIYLVLQPKAATNSHFVSQCVRHIAHAGALKSFVNTIRFNSADFKRDALKLFRILLPSADEQAAIVRFLDHANGRIERVIRAKRKLIALLHEQKQAIIHRAVTRGLDPNVKLKPSGIPWLADVPAHWEVPPLKQLLLRMDYGTSENTRGEGPVRVLGMGHIRDGSVVLPDHGSLAAVPSGLLLEHNDLLFNRTNSPELVGKVGLFQGNASDQVTFASYLVRLRVRPNHGPVWLNYLLNSVQFWSFARSQALVSLHQANLNSNRYGRMVLPVPNKAEQTRIAEFIGVQIAGIEKGIARTEREIALLREYRIRLTADVVTGKLDVREAAKRLPAEGEEMPAAPNEIDDTIEESTEPDS